jgi:hypothetical protein
MNIQNLYSSLTTTSATNVASVTNATGSPSSIPPAAGTGASTASISGPGQLFSELQQLSQNNPTEFKAVASQLASSFQTAAGQASGSDAKVLTNLANQFSQAAQTGQLQPPPGAQSAQGAAPATGQSGSSGHHHHHHHHGGGSGGSSAIQQAFENATSIVDQALGTSASTSTSSSPT